MKKVTLIGGSPMVGKTTKALELAASYHVGCISTDDIIRIIDDATGRTGTSGKNFREYYEKTPIQKQICDTINSHKNAERIIIKLINDHINWGDPIVIEGWALYPHMLNDIDRKRIDAIFMIGDEELFRKRINSSRYYANASDLVKENYLKRTLWHNMLIKSECEKYGFEMLLIS